MSLAQIGRRIEQDSPWRRWSRRTLKIVTIIVAVLIIARLAAPYIVRHAINKRLSQIPDYSGHVESVGLHIWRGAYSMTGVRIVKSNGKISEPFFSADRINFSIAWKEIFHGRLVSEIFVRNGHLIFLRGKTQEDSQLTADKRWQDVINDLFPINITLLDIRGGVLRFVDETHQPRVDIAVKDLNITATGLQNRPTAAEGALPANINLSGTTIGNGKLRLYTKLEPLADQPHFQLAMELRGVSLPDLNDLLRAYIKVNVSEGQFELVSQMAMKDGHYEGYIKPFISSLRFADLNAEDDSIGRRIWKGLISLFADLSKNPKSQQVATRIPFSGDTKNLDIHAWKTIENGLHHGFIKALSKGFEGTPDPDGVAKPAVKADLPTAK